MLVIGRVVVGDVFRVDDEVLLVVVERVFVQVLCID